MVKKNAMIHKLLAALLCVCLVLGNFSTAAVAAEGNKEVTAVNTDNTGYDENLQNSDLSYDPSALIDQVTLLAGSTSVDLRADSLKDTIKNYEQTYLLGVAADFCVFIKDYFHVLQSDAEGRVFIGGNLIIQTPWDGLHNNPGYSVGTGDFEHKTPLEVLLPDRRDAAVAIIGGQLLNGWKDPQTATGQLNDVYYENGIKYEGAYEGYPYTPGRKSPKRVVLNHDSWSQDLFKDSIPSTSGPGNWQKVDQRQTYITQLLKADDLFNDNGFLLTISKILEEQSTSTQDSGDTSITWSGNSITFEYTGGEAEKECVYFNLSDEAFTKFQSASIINFKKIPKLPHSREVIDNQGNSKTVWEKAYIIINVEGVPDGDGYIHLSPSNTPTASKTTYIDGVDISKSSSAGNNHPGVSSILYNFGDTTTPIVLSNNFQGTIFAPKAHITDDTALVIKQMLDKNPDLSLDEKNSKIQDIIKDFSNYENYRGHLSGALIAESFYGATEFGYRPFAGGGEIIRGSLEISKSVQGGSASAGPFSFTVKLVDANNSPIEDGPYSATVSLASDNKNTPIQGTISEVKLQNGEVKVQLMAGQKITIEGLPAGAKYTVTETKATGYETTVSGTIQSSVSGKIQAGNVEKADFINKYLSGALALTKTVEGKGANPDQEFIFTVKVAGAKGDYPMKVSLMSDTSDRTIEGAPAKVTFDDGGEATVTIKGGQKATISELPADAKFTVTEDDTPGYRSGVVGKNTGTIVEKETQEVAFLNTFLTGSLIVRKTVEGEGADKTKEFSFTVELSDKTINGEYGEMDFANGAVTFTLKDGETKEATDLPAGITYTVTEEDYTDEGYTVDERIVKGDIPVGEVDEVTYVNTKVAEDETEEVGSLIVRKTVEGEGADKTKEFSFTVELSDKTINGEYGEMNFADGAATFTLKDGETKEATDLPAGITYTVTEEDYTDDGYTVDDRIVRGKVPAGDSDEVAYVNTKTSGDDETEEFGSLIVRKTVEGEGADKTKEFSFSVELSDKTINGEYGEMDFANGAATFTLKDGETKEATDLPAGITYTVTEEDYTNEGYTVDERIVKGDIPVGKADEVTYVNTKVAEDETEEVGSLIVRKTVEGDGADLNRGFSFTVTLDAPLTGTYGEMNFTNGTARFVLAHGASKTAEDLPAGITYTVEEAPYDDYKTNMPTVSGKIPAGGAAEAAFLNRKVEEAEEDEEEATLTVTKSVRGTGADLGKAFEFTVTLSESLTGTYGEMTFTNGAARFTLRNGEKKTATGLPVGVTYTVAEETYANYKCEKSGETGLTSVEGATASFINTYSLTDWDVEGDETETVTGDLIVTKSVTGEGADKNRAFMFKVSLSKRITQKYGDMSFVNGVATFTLKDGESKSATGLPADIIYTVVEENAEDYVTTKTGDTGTITAGQSIKAVFINTYVADTSTDVPKTGDAFPLSIWLGLMIISLAGLYLARTSMNKSKKN